MEIVNFGDANLESFLKDLSHEKICLNFDVFASTKEVRIMRIFVKLTPILLS